MSIGDSLSPDNYQQRRQKYVTGLIIRLAVCVVFIFVFLATAYLAEPGSERHFTSAIVTLAFLAVVNIPLWMIGRRWDFPLSHFYVHWLFDLTAVTIVLHFLGGVELPYGSVGYMIMILTSAVFLSARASFIVATGSLCFFDGLVLAENFGIIPHYSQIWQHEYSVAVDVFVILATDVFFYLFAYLAGSLSEQLKATSLELARARDTLEVYNQELEQKVSDRTRTLEQRNREIEEFIHVATHDLRNIAVASSEIARRLLAVENERLSARGRRYAEELLEDGRMMNRMLAALLALFKVDHGTTIPESFQTSTVVDEVLKSYATELEERHAEVSVGVLPLLTVDKEHFRHVVGNFIDNAIKYSAATRPLRIDISSVERPTEHVFAITDNGIGIPVDQTTRIFELYHRTPQAIAMTRPEAGYGVGLAMIKRIIERWGGRVWVESVVDEGSRFHFSCPKTSLQTMAS